MFLSSYHNDVVYVVPLLRVHSAVDSRMSLWFHSDPSCIPERSPLYISNDQALCHAPENNPRWLIYHEYILEVHMLWIDTAHSHDQSQEFVLMNGPGHPSTLHTRYKN